MYKGWKFLKKLLCCVGGGNKVIVTVSAYIGDCIGATSSTREELTQFITAVNSFHPALKYTWEISDDSLSFLDNKSFNWRQRFMH